MLRTWPEVVHAVADKPKHHDRHEQTHEPGGGHEAGRAAVLVNEATPAFAAP